MYPEQLKSKELEYALRNTESHVAISYQKSDKFKLRFFAHMIEFEDS
jgi:hypothetical protein